MDSHLAINSNNIFFMRAGILSTQTIAFFRGFLQFSNSPPREKRTVEEVEQKGKMKITSLGIVGNYCEKYVQKQ